MLAHARGSSRNLIWNAVFSTYPGARAANMPKPVTAVTTNAAQVHGSSRPVIWLTG